MAADVRKKLQGVMLHFRECGGKERSGYSVTRCPEDHDPAKTSTTIYVTMEGDRDVLPYHFTVPASGVASGEWAHRADEPEAKPPGPADVEVFITKWWRRQGILRASAHMRAEGFCTVKVLDKQRSLKPSDYCRTLAEAREVVRESARREKEKLLKGVKACDAVLRDGPKVRQCT